METVSDQQPTPRTPPPMMTCGHAANAQHRDGSPSCAICMCSTVASVAPDLSTRRARCSYYGKQTGTRRQGILGNECNYGGRRDPVCQCEQPSSTALPFFSFHGDGSRDAVHKCTCGALESLHWPAWSVTIANVDDASDKITRRVHAQHDAHARTLGAEMADAETARVSQLGKARTYVISACTLAAKKADSACVKFTAKGAAPFDAFYCGCMGWD